MRPSKPHSPSDRATELHVWARRQGLPVERVEALEGDVSPRTYARLWLEGGSSAILASYPPSQQAVFERFLQTTEWLDAAGVRVPAVRAADPASLRMVLEDLGPKSLNETPYRPWEGWRSDYRRAAAIAASIAEIPKRPVEALNPVLDGKALRLELEQTRDVFWRPRKLLSSALEAQLEIFLDELCATLDEQPRKPCHRDFMVRNLIALEDEAGVRELAVIDHQDLRLGPQTYDLASLLNDSLFPPPALEAEILHQALPKASGPLGYRRCAVQRTLKAVGTFAAFAARGSSKHLPLIAPTLERCLAQLEHLEEAEGLLPELRQAFGRFQ